MSVTTTRAPSRANSRAVARPIPDAAPVTRATLSLSRSIGEEAHLTRDPEFSGPEKRGAERNPPPTWTHTPAVSQLVEMLTQATARPSPAMLGVGCRAG